MSELTDSFAALHAGDRSAVDRIFATLYPDLIRLARSRLRRSQPMTLLDTSMLVHECFLRFLNSGQVRIEDRTHFFAYAARAMRSIIVDLARKRQAERHGGALERVALDTDLLESGALAAEDKVVEIAEAIEALARLDERLASVVEMRFFAGFTPGEIAQVLGVTERTVQRDFEKARVILCASLS